MEGMVYQGCIVFCVHNNAALPQGYLTWIFTSAKGRSRVDANMNPVIVDSDVIVTPSGLYAQPLLVE